MDQAIACEGWSARDVVAHVVGYTAHELRKTARTEPSPAPSVAEDPADAFRAIRDEVLRVLDDPATTPDVAKFFDAAVSFDLPQHGWDLAKATGQDTTIDPGDVDALWNALSSMPASFWEWQVDNDHYAPRVPVSEDAPPQDRLLGLIGRDPDWEP
ncbi:MAG: TIGR03086 family protein [Actinomycetota bacterium]